LKQWLLGFARRHIAAVRAERARRPLPVGDHRGNGKLLALLQDPESLSQIWERQWREHVLAECLRQAKAHFSRRDLEIFVMLGMEEQRPDEVARALGLSPEAVRQVKYRVLKFLRSTQTDLEATL